MDQMAENDTFFHPKSLDKSIIMVYDIGAQGDGQPGQIDLSKSGPATD
jgi:hypothetical protein